MKKQLLNKLTIVILSRERNIHLKATVQFYNQYGIRLVVLHKSETGILSQLQNDNLNYIKTNKSFAERCTIAKKYINTPYAILSTDDERYLPSTLKNMVRILEKNKKVNSVGGQAIAFFTYSKLLCGQRLYSYLEKYTNNERSLQKRLIHHFKTAEERITFSSMYRMYRRKDFIKMLQLFSLGKGVSTALITEVTSEIFSLYKGNIHHVNELLWVRNFMIEPINRADWSRDITFKEWWNNETYNLEKSSWLERIGVDLSIGKVRLILGFIQKNRRNEEYKKPIRFHRINTEFKYLMRKFFSPNTLPKSIGEVLHELSLSKTRYEKAELLHALESMHSPFGEISLTGKKWKIQN